VGAPVGPTGCDGHVASGSFFVGGSAGATRTRLSFTGDREFDFEQYAATALVGYRTPSGWSFRGAFGAVLGGQLEAADTADSYDIRPGFVGSLGASRQWRFGGPVSWVVAGEDVTGSDVHHFQLGAGVSVALPSGPSAVLDLSLAGEQSASLGVSWQL